MDEETIVFTPASDDLENAIRRAGVNGKITHSGPPHSRVMGLALREPAAKFLFRSLQSVATVWQEASGKGARGRCSVDELPPELRAMGDILIGCHWVTFDAGVLWGGLEVDEVRARRGRDGDDPTRDEAERRVPKRRRGRANVRTEAVAKTKTRAAP